MSESEQRDILHISLRGHAGIREVTAFQARAWPSVGLRTAQYLRLST